MFTYQVDKKTCRRPLSNSIQEDFSLLADQFALKLQQEQANFHSKTHAETFGSGASFRLFLRFFESENVALVHTQGLPPRCDPEAFSQLLSSECLAFVHQNWNQFTHVAFGIFCLYAFYQSSPLPILHQTLSETSTAAATAVTTRTTPSTVSAPSACWQLLSMGLVHPDNPKMGYRRQFRQRIRIHRGEYVMIQRLRHVCLGYTRNTTCGTDYSKLDFTSFVHGEQQQISALATDVLEVLNRLEFQWSEYSGPRGVDAFAARAMDKGYGISKQSENPALGDHVPVMQMRESIASRATIDEALMHYHEKLQSIAVDGTSQQSRRVKAALSGLAGEESGNKLSDKTAAWQNSLIEESSRDRVAVIELHESSQLDHDASSVSFTPKMTHRISFSPTVSPSLQKDITKALQSLLHRGDTLFLPSPLLQDGTDMIQPMTIAAPKPSATSHRHDKFLMVEDVISPQDDPDISDVSDDEVQYALDDFVQDTDSKENDESALGLDALNILLKQAKEATKTQPMGMKDNDGDSVESVAPSSVGGKALMSLLQQARHGHSIQRLGKAKDKMHVDHEVVSVTESSVGRNALAKLLNEVRKTGTRTEQVNVESKRGNEGIPNCDVHETLRHGKAPIRYSTNANGDAESIAASSIGRVALSSLLQQVNKSRTRKRTKGTPASLPTRDVPDDVRMEPSSKRQKKMVETSTEGVIYDDCLTPSTDSLAGDEAPSVSASSVGQAALSSLLKLASVKSQKGKTLSHRSKPSRRDRALPKYTKNSKSTGGRVKSARKSSVVIESTHDTSFGPPRSILEDDAVSNAASSVGRMALSSLLKQANQDNTKQQMLSRESGIPTKPVRKSTKSAEHASRPGIAAGDLSSSLSRSSVAVDDLESLAGSSLGRQALSTLIEQASATATRPNITAQQCAVPKINQSSVRRQNKSSIDELDVDVLAEDASVCATVDSANMDSQSIAASSLGHQALSLLLNQANMGVVTKSRMKE